MEKRIRILILSIAFAFMGNLVFAPRAEAAAVLFFIGESKSHQNEWDGFYWKLAGLGLGIVGLVTVFFNPLLGFGLILLDDTELQQGSDLPAALAQKYPFIDSRDVISDLALALENRAREVAVQDVQPAGSTAAGDVVVSSPAALNESEIRSILAPVDLTENEILIIVKDLQ